MSTSTPRRRRAAAAAASALLSLGLGATHLAAPAGAQEPQVTAQSTPEAQATASAVTTMTFRGRGYGHGRGLSQYGAQGYATQFGWDSGHILDHYYGGTRSASVGQASNRPIDPDRMLIRLRRTEGRNTRVTVTNGTLQLTNLGSVKLPSGTKAVHLARKDSGGLDVYAATKTTCTAADFSYVGNTGTSSVDIGPTATYDGTAANMLRLCTDYGDHGPAGPSIWYPGILRSHVANNTQYTVNITNIEQQLRSVVPNESPASWDVDALEAQAVAARSYALAGDNRWTGANTCDTIYCQVYMGLYKLQDGRPVPTTAASTDQAIRNTAGVVRLHSDGRIARTEFSSTSGGWTAGGTFPAVKDEGDAISPLHTWTRTVDVSALEAAHGKGGKLTAVEVLERNGLGADGGRVIDARLRFDNGTTATVSGNTVRSGAKLLSDWFTPACSTEVRYIDAVYQLFVRRAPTADEIDRHCAAVQRGERSALTKALAVSDEWAGVQINQLYRKILGRDADAGGRSYWLSQVQRGLRIEDIAAQFYGSAEYFNDNGGTNRSFVEALYTDLLGRTADARGRDHWASQLDARRLTRQQVAAAFYASIESRTDRVNRLFLQVLGRSPDAAGRDYWTGQLRTLGDVTLAAWLAASQEYYDKAVA